MAITKRPTTQKKSSVPPAKKQAIDRAVKKAVKQYGKTFELLAKS